MSREARRGEAVKALRVMSRSCEVRLGRARQPWFVEVRNVKAC